MIHLLQIYTKQPTIFNTHSGIATRFLFRYFRSGFHLSKIATCNGSLIRWLLIANIAMRLIRKSCFNRFCSCNIITIIAVSTRRKYTIAILISGGQSGSAYSLIMWDNNEFTNELLFLVQEKRERQIFSLLHICKHILISNLICKPIDFSVSNKSSD